MVKTQAWVCSLCNETVEAVSLDHLVQKINSHAKTHQDAK